MITHIAFLRGINVGGHKKIPMAQLRATLPILMRFLKLRIHVFTFIRQLAMVVQNVIMHSSRKN